jgi:GH15 family glucan-1,4-alpha-glucosidase
LPEQIKEEKPYSIIPLAWSHSMFVIAAKFIEMPIMNESKND